MFILKLKHKFDAAHQLKNPYSKECFSLHGHSWKTEIEIKTIHLIDGMVVDFKILKEIVNKLDHKNLNEVVNFDPTAENLSKYLYNEVYSALTKIGHSDQEIIITIWESDNASITFKDLKYEK